MNKKQEAAIIDYLGRLIIVLTAGTLIVSFDYGAYKWIVRGVVTAAIFGYALYLIVDAMRKRSKKEDQ